MNGIWDLKLTANKRVEPDGFINDFNGVAEYVVQLDSVDSIITGKVLGARGSGSICSDATINGNIGGRKINYTMQYTGSCCANETEVFTGTLNSQGLLQAKGEPEKIPTSYCALWYGTIIGTKRNSDSPQLCNIFSIGRMYNTCPNWLVSYYRGVLEG